MKVSEPDVYMLRRMLSTLWIIPCDKTQLLLEFCHDLERRGFCRIERPERFEDGRVRCTLTDAGRAALEGSQ